MARGRAKNEITIARAMEKARRTMGRPVRMETYRRFKIGNTHVLVLFYSCVYSEIGRQYRYEIFEGLRSHGGGIIDNDS
jgi:hypothetical protein